MIDDYYIVVDILEILDDLVNNPNDYSFGTISEGRELKSWYVKTWQSHHKALQKYVTDCASFITDPSKTKMYERPVGWEALPQPQRKLVTFARFDTTFLNRTPVGDVAKPRTLTMGVLLNLEYPERVGHRVRYDGKRSYEQPISVYARVRDDQAALGLFKDSSDLSGSATFVTQALAVRFSSKDYIVASIPTKP